MSDRAESFRDEVKRKYPNLLAKAASSRLAGIRMFCIECHGGDRVSAKKCQVKDCFLWPHRGAAWEQEVAK
jgi:hypothetical protein